MKIKLTCKAKLYLLWTLPILYKRIVADKNKNIKINVVAIKNKLCFGTPANLSFIDLLLLHTAFISPENLNA